MRKAILSLLVLLILNGCGLVEIEDFRTKNFISGSNDSVSFSVGISRGGAENHWLYLYGSSLNSDSSVKINKMIIDNEVIYYNQTMLIDHFNESKFRYTRGFQLLDASADSLEEISKKDYLIEVFYEINGGKEEVLEFKIEKYKYHDIAWPT